MPKTTGYRSPHLNRKPIRYGAAVVSGSLCLALIPLFMILQWGTPPTPPWVEAGEGRAAGLLLGAIALLGSFYKPIRMTALLLLPLGAFVATQPIYSPALILQSFLDAPTYHVQLRSILASALISFLYGWGLVRGVKARKGAVKGTAEWGKGRVLRQAKKGFILGRWRGSSDLLRYNGDGHLMTIAATRSGKGVGTIIPNLLDHPGSVIVTDPKGENYFVTSKYRRSLSPHHKTIALDPFNLTGGRGGGHNPLDVIDLTRQGAVEFAQSMAAEMMGKSQGSEAFWSNEAKAALTFGILYIKCQSDPSSHNLAEVRTFLSMDLEQLVDSCKTIATYTESDFPKGIEPGVMRAIQEGAMRLGQKQPKELGGVLSTMQSRTHVFSSPRLLATLSSTSFTTEEILAGHVSVYIIVPSEHLVSYAPWIRTTLSSIYGMITHDAHLRPSKPPHRILFLMDEFANLGKIKMMESAISLGAGFGVSLWLILQDFNQLKEKYGDVWNTFIANSDVIQVFGIQDQFSCEQVTKLMGETTVWSRKLNKEGQTGEVKKNVDEEQRSLMTPDEIRRLHPDRQIIFVRPQFPVAANKIKFYQDSAFMDRAEPNPYLTGAPLPENVETAPTEAIPTLPLEAGGTATFTVLPALPSNDLTVRFRTPDGNEIPSKAGLSFEDAISEDMGRITVTVTASAEAPRGGRTLHVHVTGAGAEIFEPLRITITDPPLTLSTPDEVRMVPGKSRAIPVEIANRPPMPIRVTLHSSIPGIIVVPTSHVYAPDSPLKAFLVEAPAGTPAGDHTIEVHADAPGGQSVTQSIAVAIEKPMQITISPVS